MHPPYYYFFSFLLCDIPIDIMEKRIKKNMTHCFKWYVHKALGCKLLLESGPTQSKAHILTKLGGLKALTHHIKQCTKFLNVFWRSPYIHE
jgi:hypothetical protein